MQRSGSVGQRRKAFQLIPGWILAAVVVLAGARATPANAQAPTPIPCNGGQDLPVQGVLKAGAPGIPSQPDLVVTGVCIVRPGLTYYYNNVNILAGGKLQFTEQQRNGTTPGGQATNLYVSAIIIEGDGTAAAANGGVMTAGTAAEPYGSAGTHTGTLTIHLYGSDQSKGNPLPVSQSGNGPGQGVRCKSTQTQNVTGPCGIPWDRWVDNGGKQFSDLPGSTPVKDFFYQYGPMFGDSVGTPFSASPYNPGTQGYFGYKVLAVSYGGTLQLFGYKGTPAEGSTPMPTNSGTSWIRLGKDLAAGLTQMTLSREPNALTPLLQPSSKWQNGDKIVVTTTDYVPGHTEVLTITKVAGTTVDFTPATKWAHKGTFYKPPGDPLQYDRLQLDPSLTKEGVETRAAVALLTRSIRIVSGGDTVTGDPVADAFPAASTGYYFGGHTAFRQGFKSIQIQGVEFAQMGQGGKLGHYPVHFHKARITPPNTFIRDSSVNESMTRWVVIHGSQNVMVARNVGYLSIGHGFYLEDGTEINNQLYSNIGIMARAAVHDAQSPKNPQNPRNVPGILAYTAAGSSLQYNSDVVNPSVFWLSNGWNDLVGNMAVGAGTCGACYWLLPTLASDTPDVFVGPATPLPHMKFLSANGEPTYAGLMTQINQPGATPLKSFYKNYCSSAQNSFETVGEISQCLHVSPPTVPPSSGEIIAVKSISPIPLAQVNDPYYPRLLGNRIPVMCPNGNCTTAHACNNQNPDNCAVTVLDHYTSAFNWAEQNFSALWLRTNWYLLTDSVISDVQTGGLTFVSGGDYTRSSVPEGNWDLASNNLFVGQTQPTNAFAYDIGPFNTTSNLKCQNFGNACVDVDDGGIIFPLTNFGTGERMFNIYDGPVYQESNAYVGISTARGCNAANGCIYTGVQGVRRNPADGSGYLPNAAIGWKQSNGFYYPPAFHSYNLLFSGVDIRHYVISPLFQRGTYLTDLTAVQHDYASIPSASYFNNFTDIDRQTELNDDDGSLTGLINNNGTANKETIIVNQDPYFNAPVATPECDSNLNVAPKVACSAPSTSLPTPTARTSPYDYVTTVIYPACAVTDTTDSACGSWPTEVPPTIVMGPPAVGNNPNGTQYAQFQNQLGRGGTWSKDCGGPYCYGVKFYRQFLTGTDGGKPPALPSASSREWAEWYNAGCGTTPSTCDWPFDRMAGGALWQRSVLTANNGTYYIDTTPSITAQQTSTYAGTPTDINVSTVECSERTRVGVIAGCQPRSVSGFQANQTYYVLLSYAKSTTHITYQIYVGENFAMSSVTGVAAFAPGIHFQVSSTMPAPPIVPIAWPAANTWLKPAPTLITGADGKQDILQVTIDLGAFAASNLLNPKNQAANLCQPKAFCGWDGAGKCISKPIDTIDSRIAVDAGVASRFATACGTWAVKDLDFPDARLIGFSFTLPGGFGAQNQYERPTPAAFTTSTAPPPGWKTLLTQTKVGTDAAPGGACYYSAIPGTTAGCAVTDPPNTGPLQ